MTNKCIFPQLNKCRNENNLTARRVWETLSHSGELERLRARRAVEVCIKLYKRMKWSKSCAVERSWAHGESECMRMSVIAQSGVYYLPAAAGRTHILGMVGFFFVFLLWLISRVCAGVLTKTTTKNICIIWIKKQQLIISSVRLFYLAAYYLYFDFFTFHATQCFFFRFILYSENRWYTRVLLTILLFDGR